MSEAPQTSPDEGQFKASERQSRLRSAQPQLGKENFLVFI